MVNDHGLNVNHDFFSAERLEDIVIIRFKKNVLFHATDLNARDTILNYLDRVSNSDSVKVLVIFFSPEK